MKLSILLPSVVLLVLVTQTICCSLVTTKHWNSAYNFCRINVDRFEKRYVYFYNCRKTENGRWLIEACHTPSYTIDFVETDIDKIEIMADSKVYCGEY